MAPRKTVPLDGSLIARKGEAAPAHTVAQTRQEPIAITVKLDPDLYFRLKRYGMRTKPRKTNQDLMVEALTDYLAAAGA
jgi:hypothetical protein